MLKAAEDEVRGKWLCIAANFCHHGSSLVHYLVGWTQVDVDRAWVDLKDKHGARRGFGTILPPIVEGVPMFRATCGSAPLQASAARAPHLLPGGAQHLPSSGNATPPAASA